MMVVKEFLNMWFKGFIAIAFFVLIGAGFYFFKEFMQMAAQGLFILLLLITGPYIIGRLITEGVPYGE
jgi:hypothetical protein